MLHVHGVEYSSAVKKDHQVSIRNTMMELQAVGLSEISHTEKGT